jgi:hypothetical protein
MDEMAFVNIHSVHLGLGRDLTLWTGETHRIQVDRQLIRQVCSNCDARLQLIRRCTALGPC